MQQIFWILMYLYVHEESKKKTTKTCTGKTYVDLSEKNTVEVYSCMACMYVNVNVFLLVIFHI